MNKTGPRILLIGGTYRALCMLERLLERGDRVAAFIGIEGAGERDFCPEILEICDRASIPARSGHKLGEELVRWLEDRIRPDLAIAVGIHTEIPLSIGGNCRLGLLEAVDFFHSESCSGVALRQCGRDVHAREISPPDDDDDVGEVYLQMIDELVSCVEEYLDRLTPSSSGQDIGVPFEVGSTPAEELQGVVTRSEPGCDTNRLEQEVATYVGADHVFALRSTADAFRVIADILGLAEGNELIFPGLASAAAVEGLTGAGARAVYTDVDPHRLTLDPDRARESLCKRTRALVISHALGQPAELDRLYGLAQEHDLEVIEDGGESLGARFADSRLGRGPCTCVFRLPLGRGTTGLQAALVTLPDNLAERFQPRVKDLRLGDGAAALALRELEGLEDRISARRAEASSYSSELVRYDAFRVPSTPAKALSVYSAYLLRLTRFARTSADDLHKLLLDSGIETRRLHLPLADRDLAALPCSDSALTTGLLLPIEPALGEAQREHLLDAIFGYAIG